MGFVLPSRHVCRSSLFNARFVSSQRLPLCHQPYERQLKPLPLLHVRDSAPCRLSYATIRSIHLLSLPGLGQLPLTPLLGSLSSSLSVKAEVPPPEAAGVVANKLLVVNIVVLGAGPDGEEVVQTPGEFVTAVGIDGLEDTEHDPDVHGEDVEVLGESAPNDGAADGSETQDHDFDRGGVLSSEAERSRILVVNLVDVLVQERACVHQAMGPVVPGVFQDEENGNLIGHRPDAGERYGCLEAEVLAHGVKEPNLRKLDGEVGEEDEEGTLCLFPAGGDFVLFPMSGCDRELNRMYRHTC